METASEINGLTGRVIGAAIEVHRQLGPGFLESVYEEALVLELGFQGIVNDRQVPVEVNYRGRPVGVSRLDLLVEGSLVVELKAVDKLLPIHHAQVLSYLRATENPLGLLINFNTHVLRDGIKRVILTR